MAFSKGLGRLALLSAIFMVVFAAGSSAKAYRIKTLYAFCAQTNCPDGRFPQSIIADARGNFFGVAANGGGEGNDGTVFELEANASRTKWTYKLVHSFCQKPFCLDGQSPAPGLVLDTSGRLYGLTEFNSLAYRLTPPSHGGHWKYEVLYRFCHHEINTCRSGSSPNSTLTYSGASSDQAYDGVSPLYGTAEFGGIDINGPGTVFELDPDPDKGAWRQKVLLAFDGENGGDPSGTLLMDENSNLYGLGYYGGGGGNGKGVLFELSPNASGKNWSESLLHTFCTEAPCSNGAQPMSEGLIAKMPGVLLGTTLRGGVTDPLCQSELGCGVLFEFTQDGKTGSETVLHNFCSLRSCADGSAPIGTMLADGNGNYIGVTTLGGSESSSFPDGAGTIFRLSGSAFKTIYRFCKKANCVDGAYPGSGLIMDNSGRFFGTTQNGGSFNFGTVFELIP